MLVQFSIYPIPAEHMSKEIARVIEVLESAGLDYRLGPMSTAVEGDWDQVLPAIRRCHEAVAQNYGRVITSIVIDDRKHQPHHLAEMVASVEQHLGRPVRH
jgi:uncharacterized protein (TIGR00106 family)